jgi:hypothetical protein
LLFAWFEVTTKSGCLTWQRWNKLVNPRRDVPLSFVSRAWRLAMAIGKRVDEATLRAQGLDVYFRPISVSI